MNEAFGGDKNLKQEFRRAIKKYRIKTIVETGTFHGDTTKELAKMVDQVYTIEYKREFYDIAKKNLSASKNVKLLLGGSPEVMRKILPKIKTPVLFFLDAHWYRHWPLRDELQAIADARHKNCVIIIHDFHVPRRKDLKFDQYLPTNSLIEYLWKGCWNKFTETVFKKTLYKRQRLDYQYIEEKVVAINKRLKHHYNEKSPAGKPGVIIIHP